MILKHVEQQLIPPHSPDDRNHTVNQTQELTSTKNNAEEQDQGQEKIMRKHTAI